MRALLVVFVAIFVVISSVNTVPARYFLEEIKKISKRQLGNSDWDFCLALTYRCSNSFECFDMPNDRWHKCLCKT